MLDGKYLNIGTKISASVNQVNNSIIEKYCYDDNEANCAIYGGMYQWDEMMNYTASSSASPSGRQGICPAGWHIPSDDELNLLRTFAEGEYTAGGNLKEVGTSHWSEPNAGAMNSFGFTALPCGFRAPDGSFSSLSYYTNIQSATENSSTEIWTYGMHYDNTTVARSPNTKTWGTSVRCVKDPNSGIPTVTTSSVTNITETTATCGGNVTSEVGATVTARGVCWNTSSNPTISNTNTTDGSGTGTFVSNLTGLTLGTLYYIRAYATNGIGTAYGNEVSFTTVTSSGCGSSIAINHLVSGGVAPVNKTVTYGTVTNIPGEPSKCWITSNLGADYQATSVDDTTAASAGWYWQFNLKQGYQHDGTTRTPNTTWGDLIVENSDWQLANDPCILELGTGWRIPTFTEWNNVNSNGGWTNWNGPWNSGLKMHAAGALNWSDGSLSARGSLAYFWGSTQSGEANAGGLLFDSYAIWPIETFTKANGFPVRCIK